MAENLMVGSHLGTSEAWSDGHDKTFKHDTDFICYTCWEKWDEEDTEIMECQCPGCDYIAERRTK